MRLKVTNSDIHSLKKFVLNSVVHDWCISEKYAKFCSLQPVPKTQSKISSIIYNVNHPSEETLLYKALPGGIDYHSSGRSKQKLYSHVVMGTSSEVIGKRRVTSIHIPVEVLGSVTLQTVLKLEGDHGIQSELHHWNISGAKEAERRRAQRIVIDYSSPNIAKPFHAGHLRSTLIGGYIARLKRSLGDHVTRINYFGDWGTQFGLLAAGYKLFGDEKKLAEDAIAHLLDIYIKTNRLAAEDPGVMMKAQMACKLLEEGDSEVTDWWRKFRQASIENYSQIYERLGVQFDTHEWESEHHLEAKRLCTRLLEEGKLHVKNGAVVTSAKVNNKQRSVTLLKSDGSTLYSSRDVAAFIHRMKKYRPDKILYVVEKGQSDHFSNLSSVLHNLNLMHDEATSKELQRPERLEHVKFGRVTGMSTRKGSAVLLSDILDEAKQRMIDKMKKANTTKNNTSDLDLIAERLASSAVIVYDLKYLRTKDYSFNWDSVLNLGADSGPFLQITHARLHSLVQNCGVELNREANLSSLTEDDALRLIVHLARYDEVISASEELMESHVLVRFLFDLCHFTNAAFKRLRVKDESPDIAAARLLLFYCSKLTLSNGLKLLGIKPLDSI